MNWKFFLNLALTVYKTSEIIHKRGVGITFSNSCKFIITSFKTKLYKKLQSAPICYLFSVQKKTPQNLSKQFSYFSLVISVPEIEQGLAGVANSKVTVSFTPHLMPMVYMFFFN